MERTTTRARRRYATAVLVALALPLAACGNDSAETGIEELIESESGGQAEVDIGENGEFSVQTEDGGMTVDEDGNIVVTDADGSTVTGNVDGEGNVSVEGGDSDFRVDTSGEVPEEWPEEIPSPAGVTGGSATVQQIGGQLSITFTGDADTGFADDYTDQLTSAGFEQTSEMESGGNTIRVFDDGTWTVSINALDDGTVGVTVFPTAG